jgi:hypothetical protein
LDFSLPVLSNIAAAVSGEARGFKVGVRGRVREGVYTLPLGARGLCPRKIFQSYRCMQVSFSAFFQTKINTLTPAFMPVNFGKVPNPFDFQRLAAEDVGKSRHETLSRPIVLVDDLLLTSFDLVI